ncbi:SDR family NAD(P)-dependent oxidoreductase [Microcella sp.]|uniref:SDR family NAD(P)-dependent oxidoreductase n=1 Tax=Microcella sp. TaxID=1913979 RepID=UPI002564592B|nr:SDR family oxidoreductase [Microcella sp.]MBX9471476.1 SDR family oxidoreductase [Microcella sp.]
MRGDQEASRCAIVTGSTTGIGLATAVALAREGSNVLLHGLDPDDSDVVTEALRRVRREGGEAEYMRADLREPQGAAQAILTRARDRWGRIDIIVCNAAMVLHEPLEAGTEKAWRDALSVNLLAPVFLVQEAVDDLVASSGCVVMISSTNALIANRKNIVYDTSKAALNHAALNLALELRDRGVRVNTLMPGGTASPSLERWTVDFAGGEKAARAVLDDARERGSLASPDDIAAGVVMLVTDNARWVTGATIAIDGGFRLGP